MRNTSNLHSALLAAGASMEVRATINDVVYGMDQLTACAISQSVSSEDAPQIGGCVSNILDISIRDPGIIPRMASILVEVRLTDGTDEGSAEWLNMGTFYIDTRRTDDQGAVAITSYDDMLKAEQPFAELFQGDQEWPITMNAAVQLIADAIGVPVDDRTSVIDYNVPGPGEYTCREVLAFIGAANGGNWTITPDRTLRLVPFRTEEPVQDLGMAVSSIEFGESMTISQINLYIDDESAYVAGSSEDGGYALSVFCPWATQDMADSLLERLGGYAYQPFDATGSFLNPAVEPGDAITVAGRIVPVINCQWKLESGWTADISAPGDQEVDHEYPYKSVAQRQYERTMRRIDASADEITAAYSSAIKMSQDTLESTFVKETTYTGDQASQAELIETLTSELRQTAAGLEVVVQQVSEESEYLDSLRLRLGLTTSGLTLNRSNEAVYILIDNDEAVFLKDEEDGTQTPIGSFNVNGLSTNEVAAAIVKAATAEFETAVSVGRFQWVDEGSLGFSLVRRE